jgi:membrane protein required for colicin V production
MNYIDIAICVPLIWGLYRGFMRGLIVEAASLVAIGIGVWGGMNLSEACANKIVEIFNWQSEFLPIISFAIVFLALVSGVYLFAKLLAKLAKGLALGGIDKILGAAFGALKFALIISVIIFVIDAVENSYPFVSTGVKNNSVLYEPISKIAPLIIPSLSNNGI